MGFGVSLKIAPGVRVRASARGVRASVGPRVARVHVGGGRTAISSGVGPFSASSAVGARRGGGGRARAGSGSARPSLTALERQAKAAQREEQIRDLVALERSLVSLHHETFTPAQRVTVLPPTAPDPARILREQTKTQLRGIGLFNRAGRREARARARQITDQRVASEAAASAAGHRAAQSHADAEWAALCAHHRDLVLPALEDAFEDNQSPAACIDVDIEAGTRYPTVLIVFGASDMVPEQTPALTPAGRPTLRKRTKTDRNALYAAALGSTVLATVKEGFAVAPSVDELRVVVVRKDPHAASADQYVTAIYVGRFHRRGVERVDWTRIDPGEALLQAAGARLQRRGSTREIVGLDVAGDQGLRALVEQLRPTL